MDKIRKTISNIFWSAFYLAALVFGVMFLYAYVTQSIHGGK